MFRSVRLPPKAIALSLPSLQPPSARWCGCSLSARSRGSRPAPH